MNDEIEIELDRLKRDKIVSEQTAEIYLSEIRKKLKLESEQQASGS